MKLLLVDVSGVVCRAWFADPAVAGANLVLMVRKMLDGMDPSHAIAVCDSPGKTWRHELHAGYKADRPKKDDGLVSLLRAAPKLFAAYGVRSLAVEGHEADDLIASVASAYRDSDPVIWSSDKDFLQCLGWARIYDPIKDRYLHHGDVEAKFHTRDPARVVEVQGLMGDAVDCVPGAAGVGPVKAGKYVAAYGNIDGLYRALRAGLPAGMTPKARAGLLECERQVRTSLRLVTLRLDLDVPTADEMVVGPKVPDAMKDLLPVLGLGGSRG